MAIVVRVQIEDFDVGAELAGLRVGRPGVGAIASFIGTVRDLNVVAGDAAAVATLTLEHYPGMTERALHDICADASARWPVGDALVIHRVGTLAPTDQIVLVAVSAAHRGDAFDACRFVIDYLKTDAPFWKKEGTPGGARWVEARDEDRTATEHWRADSISPAATASKTGER